MESASFVALLICVITVPLIFTEYIENGFELTKAIALRVAGGLFILISLLYMLIRPTHKDNAGFEVFIDRAMDPAVFFFIFAAVVTTIFSLNPYVSYYGSYERQIGLITYIAAFSIYFLSSALIAEKGRLDKLVVFMELTAVIVSVYAFMQVLGIDPFYVPLTEHRASATFAHSIFAGGFLVLVFPFSLTRALQNPRRYYLFLMPLLLASAIVITQSRAPYVALIVEVLVIALANAFMFRGDAAKFKRLIRVSAIVAVSVPVIVALLILFVKGNPFIDRLASVLQITESARWLLWRDSFKAFALHPLLGSGIAEFSNTFEYLTSPELKKVSIFSIYDNAHNNYLQVLCTMGLLGILAYLTTIIQAIRLTLKTVLSQAADGPAKYIMLSCFAAICGYMVFGLADFDDTSIILYIFLTFSIIKVTYSRFFKSTFEIQKLKIPAYAAAVLAAAFSVYSISTAYSFLKADSFYQDAKAEYVAGNFGATVKLMNQAVTLNYGCAEYKYMLAGFVYDYCVKNPSQNPGSKNSLLKQAEGELERAKPNINSLLKYKAMMAVILLEQGRTGEGEQLKDEVFKADSISVQLRNNLARYYFAREDYPKMLSELLVIYRNHPGDVDASLTNMAYYLKIGDYQKAFWCCEYVVKCQPSNEKAKQVLEELKGKLK